MTHNRRRLRLLVLAISLLWFVSWTYVAFVNLRIRDVAESDRFLADGRGDWTVAELYKSQAQSAGRRLNFAVAIGFGLPLALLVIFEMTRRRVPDIPGGGPPSPNTRAD